MNDEHFQKLVQSVHQMGAIMHGEKGRFAMLGG